jgi:DNA-binding transcriptional LysR family regulator
MALRSGAGRAGGIRSGSEAVLLGAQRSQRGDGVDQLEAMRVFVAVAERGSLSSAARALGLPVASVSRKLTALETQLGVRLLARSTRRTVLSDAGRRYLESCRDVLARVEDAARAVGGDGAMEGELAISAPVAFGRLHVLPVVVEFLERHPKLRVRFQLVDRIAQLAEEGVDVAVRIAALPASSLMAQRVGAIRLVCCASPAYLERHGTPERPEDLAGHACIGASVLSSAARWSFPGKRGVMRVAVRTRLGVTTAEAAVDAACAGLGIARVLSYQAAGALADGRLRRILADREPPATPVHVVHADGRAPRPMVREFVSLAATRLRSALRS